MGEFWDVAVIGGGAAGLMAAVGAGRSGAHPRVIVLDGAKHLGAKILVAGGGRCNVTHETVDEADFCGSSPKAIAKVLRRFSVADTVSFFADLGVELKREETGKLFPVTDRARSVLDALLAAARSAGVTLRHPWRAASVERNAEGFVLRAAAGAPPISARRVVLATGGKSLPKSGSDGQGYALARALGHTPTPRILPALVPLCLPGDHPFTGLAGISFPARLEVHNARGKRLAAVTGSCWTRSRSSRPTRWTPSCARWVRAPRRGSCGGGTPSGWRARCCSWPRSPAIAPAPRSPDPSAGAW
jgi:predicted Rossmann fold flavoprotein